MNFKKLIACVAALSICAMGFGQFSDYDTTSRVVYAESSTEIEGLKYKVLDDGTVEISKYTGEETELVIPETIDEKKVTIIGDSAFSGCKSIASITIPDSVIVIDERAFSGCTNLTSITLSNSITNIKAFTFAELRNLTNVTIPDSVTSIENYAFYWCTGLESVSIPDSVTSIGDSAFTNCKSLTSVIIPDSVTGIGKNAFSNCTSLTNITIPDSVTSIGDIAFYGCKELVIYGYENSYAQTYATENKIPFEIIGFAPSIPETPETNTFKYFEYKVLDDGTVEISKYTGEETELVIPETIDGKKVTIIGEKAFNECKSLTSVTIPNSIISIEKMAFRFCESITSIIIPDSVTNIGDYAFEFCESLKSITIPNSVTYLGDGIFNATGKVVIYGYKNSEAQTYAQLNKLTFEIIGSTSGSPETTEESKGDIDNNGVVSASDLISLIRYIIMGEDSSNILAADMNKDGEVNVLDVIYLKQILLK